MKTKKLWPIKECKECKKNFQPWNNSQTYCKNPCSPKPRPTIAEVNAAWAHRDEEYYRKKCKTSKDNFNNGHMRLV